MTKASEVMTRSLATCTPEACVSDVATIMRDRNIGAVLILKDGELHGIVTDRDLAVRALTGKEDSSQAPIDRYMSTPVVTGQEAWSMERLSEVMAKHQIRRLPIVENGQLTGIVSLGDVALLADKPKTVAKSLQAISGPAPVSLLERVGRGRILTAIALVASATTVFGLLAANNAVPGWRKKSAKNAWYRPALHRLSSAGDRIGTAARRETERQVRDLRVQLNTRLGELSAQVAAVRN